MTKEPRGVPRYRTQEKIVPGDEDRLEIIRESHELSHQGQQGTEERIRMKGYLWPKMRMQIAEYVRNCVQCQKHQRRGNYQAPLHPIAPPNDILKR